MRIETDVVPAKSDERWRLVLVPGNDLGGAFYRPLAEKLAEGGATTALLTLPTLLGRKGDSFQTWDGILDGVEQAVETQRGAILVGHSLGGLLAFLVSARRGERVERLVLLEPAIAPGRFIAKRGAKTYRRDVLEKDRDTFVNWTGVARRIYRPQSFPRWAVDQYLETRRTGGPEPVGTLLDTLHDLYPLPFAGISAPTLLLRGQHSGWRAALGVTTLRRSFANAQVRVIQGAAHWMANEADDAVARAILEFCSGR